MSLKLGNTGINKLFLGSGEIKKAYLGSTLVFDNSVIPLYNDVSVMYSLRRPSMTVLWTNAILKLRRSSDNQTAFVFIDGNSINDTISLNSLISTSSNTTPSATTLTTWVGANDAFVEEWIGIENGNSIDSDKTAIQTTTTTQPQFISSGSIITKNGKPTIDFLSSTRYLEAFPNTDLDSGETFTIFSVSYSNSTSNTQAILSSRSADFSGVSRLSLYNDRRSNKTMSLIRNTLSANFVANYISQQDNANQRLQTNIVTPSDLKGYLNGTLQETVPWSGAYLNTGLQIGVQTTTTSPLNGGIQEIPIFPSDKTADLTTIESDINNYYLIP